MLGWLYAVGWLVSGFWWLYISMHDYGGLHPVLAALAVLLLAALLGLYYAAAAAVAWRPPWSTNWPEPGRLGNGSRRSLQSARRRSVRPGSR